MWYIIELSVKSSKESTEIVNLLKTRNKVVEVGICSKLGIKWLK
jgi:hypothetical protein